MQHCAEIKINFGGGEEGGVSNLNAAVYWNKTKSGNQRCDVLGFVPAGAPEHFRSSVLYSGRGN